MEEQQIALSINIDSARAPTSLGTGTHLNQKSGNVSIDYDGWGKKNAAAAKDKGEHKTEAKNQDSLKKSEDAANRGIFNFDVDVDGDENENNQKTARTSDKGSMP